MEKKPTPEPAPAPTEAEEFEEEAAEEMLYGHHQH